MNRDTPILPEQAALDAFTALVREQGQILYRDLPWRDTRDPYEVLVSEVMLQQTQVVRVLSKWEEWLERFPTVDALAAAPLAAVLERWKGLGYNRRAVALKRAAEECSELYGGILPVDEAALVALPGIGPATASGVRAFAHNLPGVYLETNVRAVVLHEFFPDREGVPDREIIPIVQATCDPLDPRGWYYALLDYGAHLKRTNPNPSRRSKHHTTQSRFEGSHRQKRSWLLRAVMDTPGISIGLLALALSDEEEAAGRPQVSGETVRSILAELASEGFVRDVGDAWFVA